MAVMYLGIAVVLGVILLALLFRRRKNAIYTKKDAVLGYARTHNELGNFAEIAKEGGLSNFIINSHKRFGPVFEYWQGKNRIVSICGLEMIKAVKHLPDRPEIAFQALIPLIGTESVFYTKGEEYVRRRKLLHAPFFSISSIYQNLVPKLREQIAHEVLPFFDAAASTGQPTKMHEPCVNYTVKAIAYLIGSRAEKADVMAIIDSQERVFDSLYANANGKVMTQEDKEDFEVKLGQMKSVMKKLVAEAKVSESPSLLKVYADESEEVVLCDMMSFFVGGFHTTSYLLQWSLYLAAKYPEEQDKLYRELIGVEGDLSSTLESLPVLRNFVDEALRWIGIANGSLRVSKDKDIVLPGGFVIPKGTAINMRIAQIMQDETLWDRPNEFMPDRFNDPESRSQKFNSFGSAGGRTCPGKSMALTEAKLFIGEVFRRFSFGLPSLNYSVEKNYVFVTHPKSTIELLVSRR
jgi:cytochrome P450 family 20 subfamily A